MLKITRLLQTKASKTTSGGAGKISNYYLNEEKALDLTTKTEMTEESAKALGLNYDASNISGYVLAETSSLQATWYGKLAEEFGLAGKPVEEHVLANALDGKVDGYGQVRTRTDGTRKYGYDLTFSAPKGFSVMAEGAGDTRLKLLHEKSVKIALDAGAKFIADHRSKNPETGNVERIPTDMIMYALNHHITSRALDPHMHTHAMMPNMTLVNGILRAIGVDDFYDNKLNIYLGCIYQAEMNKGAMELGYKTKSLGNGQYDLSEVPQAVIDNFSKRRAKILEVAEEVGVKSQSDIVALITRDAKDYEGLSKVQGMWKGDLDEFKESGIFDSQELLGASISRQQAMEKNINESSLTPSEKGQSQNITPRSESVEIKPEATNTIDRTITNLSNYQTTLSYHAVLERALTSFNHEEGINFADLKNALDDRLSKGELVALDGDATKFTTKALIESEKKLIDQSKIQVRGIAHKVKDKLINQCELNKENSRSIKSIFESPKQSMLVNTQGHNYETIGALLHVGENSGKKVTILTPNSYQMLDNNANLERQSKSLFQWVKNQFKDEHSKMLGGFINSQGKKNTLGREDIIVVDKANQLSVRDTQKLLEITQKGKAKVVFLDNETSRGFKSGNVTETLANAGVQSFQWSNEKQRELNFSVVEVGKENYDSKAIDIKEISPDSLIICSNRREAKEFNALTRSKLKEQEHLPKAGRDYAIDRSVFLSKEHQLVAGNYKVGQTIKIMNAKNKLYTYNISAISRKDNTLELENAKGHKSKFNPAKGDHKRLFITQTESIELCKNDKLINNGADFAGLVSGQTYTVKSADKNIIRLEAGQDEIIKISPAQLAKTGLEYDYSRTLDYVTGKEQRTFVGAFKSYAFKKEVVADIQNKIKEPITIYTDNAEKLSASLTKNDVKSSAIRTAIESSITPDKGVEKIVKTDQPELISKLESSLDNLNANYNKDVITKSVEHAVNLLSDRQAAFTENEIMEKAVAFAHGNYDIGISHADVTEKLAGDNQYLKGVEETWWTTKEAVETEKFVLNTVNNGKDKCESLITKEQVLDALDLDKNKQLTQGQREAITLLSTSKDQYVMVQGHAGSGKTTMLEVLQESVLKHVTDIHKENNEEINFIGLAPTNSAVKSLHEKNINSQTVASFLFEHKDKENVDLSNSVIILDESSMVSNNDFKLLTEIVEKSGARVAFVGDVKQIESVAAGALFRLIQSISTIAKATMHNVIRQKEAHSQEAVKALYEEDVDKAQSHFEQQKSGDTVEYNDSNRINLNVVETGSAESTAKGIAEEYLSRTESCRENTLIVANSHDERGEITQNIRDGLRNEKALGEEVKTERLINLNVQETAMKGISLYKKGQVFQLGNDYYTVEKVDKDNKLLELKNILDTKIKTVSPLNMNHKFNGLFKREECTMAVNDVIISKVTDKAMGLMANEVYKVKSVNEKEFTIASKDKSFTFDNKDIKHKLWDYAYTFTTLASQGQSHQYTIIANKSNSPLANFMTDLVAKTRHIMHMTVFVDDKSKYISAVKNNDGRNKIAMEIVGDVNLKIAKSSIIQKPFYEKFKNKNTEGKLKTELQSKGNINKNTVDKESLKAKIAKLNQSNESVITTKEYDHKYLDAQGKFDIRLYGKDVARDLVPLAKEVAEHYLGGANKEFSSSNELRFGAKGSLSLTLNGPHAGKYTDFESGAKGDLITLIMNETGMKYTDAVMEAVKFSNTPEAYQIREKTVNKPVENKKDYSEYALKVWDKSRPIKGTLAEKYLTQIRGISNFKEADIRFNPAVFTKESSTKSQPALVASFRDKDNKITAIEAIYLDKNTADKAGFKVGKRTYGKKSGAAIEVGKNTKLANNTTYIAEGLVTSLSVKEAIPNAHIYSVGSKSNFINIDISTLNERVIICADNDGIAFKKDKSLQKVVKHLQENGKVVDVLYPKIMGTNSKIDYNDVLLQSGKNEISKQLKSDKMANIDKTITGLDDKLIASALAQKDKTVSQNKVKHVDNSYGY